MNQTYFIFRLRATAFGLVILLTLFICAFWWSLPAYADGARLVAVSMPSKAEFQGTLILDGPSASFELISDEDYEVSFSLSNAPSGVSISGSGRTATITLPQNTMLDISATTFEVTITYPESGGHATIPFPLTNVFETQSTRVFVDTDVPILELSFESSNDRWDTYSTSSATNGPGTLTLRVKDSSLIASAAGRCPIGGTIRIDFTELNPGSDHFWTEYKLLPEIFHSNEGAFVHAIEIAAGGSSTIWRDPNIAFRTKPNGSYDITVIVYCTDALGRETELRQSFLIDFHEAHVQTCSFPIARDLGTVVGPYCVVEGTGGRKEVARIVFDYGGILPLTTTIQGPSDEIPTSGYVYDGNTLIIYATSTPMDMSKFGLYWTWINLAYKLNASHEYQDGFVPIFLLDNQAPSLKVKVTNSESAATVALSVDDDTLVYLADYYDRNKVVGYIAVDGVTQKTLTVDDVFLQRAYTFSKPGSYVVHAELTDFAGHTAIHDSSFSIEDPASADQPTTTNPSAESGATIADEPQGQNDEPDGNGQEPGNPEYPSDDSDDATIPAKTAETEPDDVSPEPQTNPEANDDNEDAQAVQSEHSKSSAKLIIGLAVAFVLGAAVAVGALAIIRRRPIHKRYRKKH